MYEVMLDDKTLYYPGDKEYVLIEAELNEEVGDAGYFEFTLPSTNPLYEDIRERVSEIKVYKDSVLIFNGEVREITKDFNRNKKVYAVGEMAYLFDSYTGLVHYENKTRQQLLELLIDSHNNQTEKKKWFFVGSIGAKAGDEIAVTFNYEDTLSAIREHLLDGMYLRVRRQDNERYIDLMPIEAYGKNSNQSIEFGLNLLDYSEEVSGNNIATAVIPLGCRLDESQVEGADSYLTIKDVNDGEDYVFNEEAVKNFGWIKKKVNYNACNDPKKLKELGMAYLTSNQYADMTLELDAVDLSDLERDIDAFGIGDRVHAVSEPFGMDTWFPVKKKTTDILDPSKNHITLSNTSRLSFTKMVTEQTDNITKEIPKEASFLELARKNASSLINSSLSGNVALKFGENGKPEELLIMDTPDPDTALKLWRWNLGGLGYSSDGYNGTYGTAITMDGSIVADYITAGTLTADIIKTGVLKDKLGNFVLDVEKGTLKLNLQTKVGDTTLQGMLSSIRASAEAITTEVARAKGAEGELNAAHSGRYVPTESNAPANGWTTNELKIKHRNDIFINTDTGDTYMWQGGSYGVVLTFSDDSATEGQNWDYVRIYYKASDGSYRYSKNYGGNGSGNNIAGKKVYLPTTDFYVYWHTDGSVHGFYGFKFSSCVVGAVSDEDITSCFSGTAQSLPCSITNELSGLGTFPESAHDYVIDNDNTLWHWDTGLSIQTGGFKWVKQTDFSTVYSQIRQTADQISLKVSANDVESLIDQKADSIRLKAGSIVVESTNFSVDANGNVTARNADIQGTIKIGGSNNSMGVLRVFDSSGTEYFTITDSGMEMLRDRSEKLVMNQGFFTGYGYRSGYWRETGLLDLAASYADGKCHVALKGNDVLHLQAGGRINFEVSGGSLLGYMDSSGYHGDVYGNVRGEVYPSNGVTISEQVYIESSNGGHYAFYLENGLLIYRG